MLRTVMPALILILAGTSSLCAQGDGTDVQKLLKQMDAMRQRLDQSDAREKKLQNKVETLEGQLDQQKQLSEAQLEAIKSQQLSPTDDSAAIQIAIQSLQQFQTKTAGQSRLTTRGYFDIEFRDDDSKENSTFDQHRLVLQFNGAVVPNLISFRSEIEFEGGGADASFLSGNEVVVEFAELQYNVSRSFNLKAGVLLVPFGRFNTLHDSPLRDLTDRPLVARRIIPSTWADAGVGAYGVFDVGSVQFDYNVALINGLDEDFSSTRGGGFRGNRNSFRADNNDNKMIVGRLGIRPEIEFFDVAYVGLSFAYGKYDDQDDQSITMWGVDWTFKKGDFELIGEFATYNLDRSMREFDLGAPGGADGFYAQINFHFFPESWRGTSRFFTDESTFTLVFRVGTMDTDDSATGIDRGTRGDAFRDDVWRYTLGLNFRPREKSVIKLEYQFWSEQDGIEQAGNDRFVISFATYF